MTSSFQFLPSSSFTYHFFIRRYIVLLLVAENASLNKLQRNKEQNRVASFLHQKIAFVEIWVRVLVLLNSFHVIDSKRTISLHACWNFSQWFRCNAHPSCLWISATEAGDFASSLASLFTGYQSALSTMRFKEKYRPLTNLCLEPWEYYSFSSET